MCVYCIVLYMNVNIRVEIWTTRISIDVQFSSIFVHKKTLKLDENQVSNKNF